MAYLKAKKMPAQYDVEDLEDDVRSFYKRVGAKQWEGNRWQVTVLS